PVLLVARLSFSLVLPRASLATLFPYTTLFRSFEAAPLVRSIAACAYRAGSPLVEVIWGDETMLLTRFEQAPRQTLGEFSAWLPKDRKSTRLNSSHSQISYAVFCLKKKKAKTIV